MNRIDEIYNIIVSLLTYKEKDFKLIHCSLCMASIFLSNEEMVKLIDALFSNCFQNNMSDCVMEYLLLVKEKYELKIKMRECIVGDEDFEEKATEMRFAFSAIAIAKFLKE